MKISKEELIANQQIEIIEYKEMLKENYELKRTLWGMFYSMGQPLNDNILQFNQDQQNWCSKVIEVIEKINCICND